MQEASKSQVAPMASTTRPSALLHFTSVGAATNDAPVITHGEGCYVYDRDGRKLLDGLAGLFAVQIGYSHGAEIAAAATEQMKKLPYCSNWGFHHKPSLELAEEVTALAPDGFNSMFFVSGGSEAAESAWKFARQYFHLRGEKRWKAITRKNAYHGTTLGALSLTGIASIKNMFEPLVPGSLNVRNACRMRRPPGETESAFVDFLLDDFAETIECAGPESVAIVFMEPVQTSGGAIPPPRGYYEGIRRICDRHGILICSDEVINAFGRLGEWFAAPRYGLEPDIITCAKGISSAYSVVGGVLVSDRALEPFRKASAPFAHGLTFGGHPLQLAIAAKNIDLMKRLDVLGNVRRNSEKAGACLRRLMDLPMVGDVRGDGYLWAIELVEDKATLETLGPRIRAHLAEKLLPSCLDKGLICRVDMRAVPSILISPPLIATVGDFAFIESALRTALTETFSSFRGAR